MWTGRGQSEMRSMSGLGMWSRFALFLLDIAYVITVMVGINAAGLNRPIQSRHLMCHA